MGGGGGWWWVVVAWSNLVSAQGPLVLGLGLKGLGPGLDNKIMKRRATTVNTFLNGDYIEREVGKCPQIFL